MILRLFLLLFLLFGAFPSAAEARDLPEAGGRPSCRERFVLLGERAKNGIRLGKDWLRTYGRELRETYGLRFFLRELSPEEGARERRWLGFWNEQAPGSSAWYQYLYQQTRSLLDPEFAARPRITDEKKFAYEFFNGIDYLVNSPVRIGSRALERYGFIEKERHLTLPMLMVGGYFALDYPVSLLAEHNQKAEENDRRALLVSDYRFLPVILELRRAARDLKELEAKGASSEAIAKMQATFDAAALLSVERIEKQYEEYFSGAEEFRRKWTEADPKDRPQLEAFELVRLSHSPLFQDIPRGLGIEKPADLLNPEVYPTMKHLFMLRERLYYRYSLIPAIVAGAEKLSALERDPVHAAEVRAIQASPIYRELKALYGAKAIELHAFQRMLMEDSFWELDRFAVWNVIGFEKEKIGKDGKPIPGSRLTREDIQEDMREALRAEKGVSAELRRLLPKK